MLHKEISKEKRTTESENKFSNSVATHPRTRYIQVTTLSENLDMPIEINMVYKLNFKFISNIMYVIVCF